MDSVVSFSEKVFSEQMAITTVTVAFTENYNITFSDEIPTPSSMNPLATNHGLLTSQLTSTVFKVYNLCMHALLCSCLLIQQLYTNNITHLVHVYMQ